MAHFPMVHLTFPLECHFIHFATDKIIFLQTAFDKQVRATRPPAPPTQSANPLTGPAAEKDITEKIISCNGAVVGD